MRALIIISAILFATISRAQGHTDLKEYGYKGPVRTVTTYYFDTLLFDKSDRIYSTKNWRNKIVYKFARTGNLDSIITFTQLPHQDTVYINKTAFFNKYPSRFAVRLNGDNSVTDTVKYAWLSDTSYQTTEVAVKGDYRVLSDYFLDKNYRDKAGSHSVYNGKDGIEFSEKYENTIGRDGLLTKSIRTNLLENTTSTVGYAYFGRDKYGNPTKILLANLPGGKVFRIVLRAFEYY